MIHTDRARAYLSEISGSNALLRRAFLLLPPQTPGCPLVSQPLVPPEDNPKRRPRPDDDGRQDDRNGVDGIDARYVAKRRAEEDGAICGHDADGRDSVSPKAGTGRRRGIAPEEGSVCRGGAANGRNPQAQGEGRSEQVGPAAGDGSPGHIGMGGTL